MSEFKLTINNPKTGKSYGKTVNTELFKGRKIRDKVKGDSIGLGGYELEITGGSDNAGFPMRRNIHGTSRKKVLLVKGPCVKIRRRGMKKRKTVRGNILALDVAQINLKVVKEGSKKIDDLLGKEDKEKVEEKKEVKKEEKKKEKPKEKVKKEEKKEDIKKEGKVKEVKKVKKENEA